MWSLKQAVLGFFLCQLMLFDKSFAFVSHHSHQYVSKLNSKDLIQGHLQIRSGRQTLKAVLDPVDTMSFLHSSQEWMSSAMNVFADTAMAVEEVAKDPSWWDQWLNFVEGSIKQLHTGLLSVGVDSWGVTIVCFTLLVKLLLVPLNWTQLESAQKMQLIGPATKNLAEKIKDKQTLNIMTAQLYEQAQVNPLAGCIPSLVQIPVFIALYRSILELSTENLLNEPFLFLPSLAGPVFGDRSMGWLTGVFTGNPPLGWTDTLLYLLIPISLVVSQSVSMKLMTPPAEPNDEAGQRVQAILKYLPFMIGYFSLQVPSGLSVYWMINNIFTTGTTLGIKQYFKVNPPELDFGDFKKILESEAPVVQTFEEALEEARLHELPPRTPRRMA